MNCYRYWYMYLLYSTLLLLWSCFKDRLRLDELLQVLVYLLYIALTLELLKDRLRLDELLQELVYLL